MTVHHSRPPSDHYYGVPCRDLWLPARFHSLFCGMAPDRTRPLPAARSPVDALEFSDRLRRVLSEAREEAARLRHEHVGTEHLLLALLADSCQDGAESPSEVRLVFDVLAVDRAKVREVLEQTVLPGRAHATEDQLSYTSRAKAVLELAMAEARVARQSTVDAQHLLLGLVREERGIAAQVLLDFGVTVEKTRAELSRLA